MNKDKVNFDLPIDWEELARTHPEALFALVRGYLQPHELTFAAEALGKIKSGLQVVEVLVNLLNHESAVVREGAIYGLEPHIDKFPYLVDILKCHLNEEYEESLSIRNIIKNILRSKGWVL